jgi:lipid-A-disaccharide synthase
MKYFLVAGERSGDLHGGNLINALKHYDAEANFRGFGGDAMAEAGMQVLVHYQQMAFMGFLEVAKNLPAIFKLFKTCKQEILKFRPDVLILIDYAGFNLRLARWAKEQGIKVYYYISPKVWAWNPKRAEKIKRYVDRMFVIMPFEQAFYANWGMLNVDYVGNPLLDAVKNFVPNEDFKSQLQLQPNQVLVALLPGSRKQEVSDLLPVMLEVAQQLPEVRFAIAAVRTLDESLYSIANNISNVTLVWEDTYNLLVAADAAIVASGTATLETALFKVPQVVVYKTSWASYQIAKRLITVDYISLVNLIAEKGIVPELIQDEMNEVRVLEELKKILPGENERRNQLEAYGRLLNKLGNYKPSNRTAELIWDYLQAGKA